MTWTEQGDTHTARVGDYTLKVWKSTQYQSFGWTITRGHILKAGDVKSLDDAKREAETAMSLLSKD